MPKVVDGRKISQNILAGLKPRVEKLNNQNVAVKLGVILVGEDKPSQTYVRNKGGACREAGIDFQQYNYDVDITTAELIKNVKKIQEQDGLSGLIIQLPLPEHINGKKVVNCIDPAIDVDCLTFFNLGKLVFNQGVLRPPTPDAILEVLRYYQVDLEGKHLVLLGRGELIGKPLSLLLAHEEVTLTICNRSTPDISKFTKEADIIVSGVGKYPLVKGEMIKEGAVVLDAGVCFVDGKMHGDIEFDSVAEKAALVTPTPGGVGPITVAKLLENTVKAAESCSLIDFKSLN